MRNRQHKKRDSIRAYLFLLPSLAGVMIFILLPFADVVRRSFYDAMGKQPTGIANYVLVLENEAFRQAVYNTARFLITCIPLLLVSSFAVALLIQATPLYGDLFKTVFLVPMAVPVASVVLLWQLLFDQTGYLNQILALFGREAVDWMNNKSAFGVLVFSYLWKNTGYDMVLWLAGLSGISSSLYEAAKVDGAGAWKCLRYITLPNLKQTVFVITVLSFINSFKVFREAYLVAGDYPNDSIYMMQHLFNNWFVKLDIHKMSAAAVMMASVIALVLIFAVSGKEES